MWDKRSFDRLVSFTDAVTAVAITLLILSIIDIRATPGEGSVWQVIADNSSELITFGFTFVVVAVMWQAHLRVFHRLIAFDAAVFWLNLLWLIGIVLLPWTSAMYGEGIGVAGSTTSRDDGMGGTGLLYWSNLAVISWSAALIGWHALRHPELCDAEARVITRPRRGFIFGLAFLTVGVATAFAPVLGSWLALIFIPLGIYLSRVDDRRARNAT